MVMVVCEVRDDRWLHRFCVSHGLDAGSSEIPGLRSGFEIDVVAQFGNGAGQYVTQLC